MRSGQAVVFLVALLCVGCARTPVNGAATSAHETNQTGPTLLVVNSTCANGACAAFDVGVGSSIFPPVPGTPSSGWIPLGHVGADSACLTLPGSWVVPFVSQSAGSGADDTTKVTWTPEDSAWIIASVSRNAALGQTVAFAPSQSSGWRIVLPGSDDATTPVPSLPCSTN